MKIGATMVLFLATLVWAAQARADTKCDLDFHLEGWSAFYKTSHGGGRITCDNGQSARIVIRTKGGGITFGHSKIVDGVGHFSPVSDISELFGDYANAEAHAGAGESSAAQVVTKGTVSLAFSGKGRGIDLCFAFGKFTIAHAAPSRHVERSQRPGPRLEEAPLDERAPPPRHEPGSAY
jgi:hypothetical protein